MVVTRAISLLLLLSLSLLAQAVRWHPDAFGHDTVSGACSFLTLPVSAGAMGISDVASPGMLDATDLARLPASSGLLDRASLSATHLEWGMGIRQEYFGLAIPVAGSGTAGLYSRILTIQPGSEAYTVDGEEPSHLGLEYALGATVSQPLFNRHLSIGLCAAYLHSGLGYAVGHGFALSGDLLFLPYPWISGRLFARNLGLSVSGYLDGVKELPLQAGGIVSFSPFQSIEPETDNFRQLTLSAGYQWQADEPVAMGIGAQWHPLTPIFLRAGVEFPNGGVSSGIGIKTGARRFDAAWKRPSPSLGSVFALSLSLDIEDYFWRSSSYYHSLARDHFDGGRYKDSRYFATEAALIDPNCHEAQMLLRASESRLMQVNRREIGIIYYGNIQGQFQPRTQGDNLGGLSRLAMAVERLRREIPLSLTVAAGNILTDSASKDAATAAHLYYHYVHNDATCIGKKEFNYGIKDFLGASSTRMTIISIDGTGRRLPRVAPGKIFNKGGYAVGIVSMVNLEDSASSAAGLPACYDSLRLALGRSDIGACHLKIAVIHDSWESLLANKRAFAKADIVICGSLDKRFDTPRRIGGSLVLSPGKGGLFLGKLMVRFDRNRELLTYDNRFIPVDDRFPVEPSVQTFVSGKPEIEKPQRLRFPPDSVKKALKVGVFPFLSDRNDSTGLYLKMLGWNVEMAFDRNVDKNCRPAISLDAGKIAYFRRDTSGCNPLMTVSTNAEHKRTLVDSCSVREVLFSPDGSWIYYAAAPCGKEKTDLYKIRSEGGISFPIITWENSGEKDISFSPDFSQMVFSSDRDGSWQVYLTNPEGDHPLRLTDAPGNATRPSFSPNGKKIAYLSDLRGQGRDLWVYDFTIRRHRQLTRDTDINSYCWFDNSRYLVVSSGVSQARLMIASADTGLAWTLFQEVPPEHQASEIQPRMIRWKGKWKIVYVREFSNGERSTYWADADGDNDHPLITSRRNDWLGEP